MTEHRPATQYEVLTLLEEEFFLTTEDTNLINNFSKTEDQLTWEKSWNLFAQSVKATLLKDYQLGYCDLEKVLKIMRKTSLGCSVQARLYFLGSTAEAALKMKRSSGLKKKGDWWNNFVADLLITEKEKNPTAPLFDSENLDSIYAKTIGWLTTFAIGETIPSTKTMEKWYHKRKKELGLISKRGRPPQTNPSPGTT